MSLLKKYSLLYILLAAALSCTQLHGIISLDATPTFLVNRNNLNNASYTIGTATGSYLMVGFNARNNGGPDTTISLSWSGGTNVLADYSIISNQGTREASIFVFDLGNVGVGETVTINWDGTTVVNEHVSFLQVSNGSEPGQPLEFISNTQTTSTSTSFGTEFTDLPEESLIFTVGTIQNNNRSLQSTTPSSVTGSGSANGSRTFTYLYDFPSTGGDLNYGFNMSGSTDGSVLSAFAVIPESSHSSLLFSLAAVGLVTLRRRRQA
ncbi:MAG: hypothetical protein AAGA45_02575 [Verrucomicrobiota bacterium]